MKHTETLYVNMFGDCVVTRRFDDNIRVISDRDSCHRKVWQMLAYLLWNHDKPVHRDALIDLLWADEDIADPANSLKALMFRLRNLLGQGGLGFEDPKNILILRGGHYQWNEGLEIILDTSQFEDYHAAATKAKENSGEALEHSLSAIDLYKGDFLSRGGENNWVTPLGVYFHAKFIRLAESTVNMLSNLERYEEIIELCQRVVLVEPYNEFLHGALIRALVATGAVNKAIQHYQHITDVFMKQFGVGPSEELAALYKSLYHSEVKFNLGEVRSKLTEENMQKGAYFCSYTSFKEFYHLFARSVTRTGEAVQLIMLTLRPWNGKKLNNQQPPIQQLAQVISDTLRLGDVVTQFSKFQYLILLPSASYENAEKVAARLLKGFGETNRSLYTLGYSVIPMLPAMQFDLLVSKENA